MASIGPTLGAGSGMDLTSLLEKLMTAEAIPLNRLQVKEAGVQAQISAFGQLNSSLSAVRDAVTSLTAAKFKALSASSSDKEVATVKAGNGAPSGSFSLEVVKTALAEKAVSSIVGEDGKVPVRGGVLSFSFGAIVDDAFQADGDAKQIVIAEGSTLADVSKAINDADIGVTATLINDEAGTRLMFTGNATGAKSTFKIEGVNTGADGASLAAFNYDPSTAPEYVASSPTTGVSRLQIAADAEFKIDGLLLTSGSNTVDKAFTGVTLELVKAGTTVVNLTKDNSGAKTALQALVTTFNGFLAAANSLSSNSASTTPGEENSANGPLAGDSLVRGIFNTIRDEIFQPADGATGAYNSLASLGVTFDKTGKLSLDSEVFDKAMEEAPGAVAHLFDAEPTGPGSQGIGARFTKALEAFVGDNGSIDARMDGLSVTTKDMQTQQDALKLRLTQIEARYRQQFTALDTMLTSMNNTSGFLAQQINSLAALR